MSSAAVPPPPTGEQDLLNQARTIWRKAQVVYQSPSWEGHPEARALAERIAAECPECEAGLLTLLGDESQLVVAYALLTLELMNSPALRNLSAEVLERPSQITLTSGSFRIGMDLGGLARQVQKRARQSAMGEQVSPSRTAPS